MQQSRRPWTKNEDDAVIQIVEEIGLKNWPLVSNLMRQRYNVNGRSGKQCRQRWHNQLNPQVNKKPWTEQEQKLLFEAHKIHKNKWIDISKLFEGRTDNSIKNHFYSTIRRSLRRICKLLGNKNSTSELRNIKPFILSKIFQYSELKGDEVTSQNEHMVNQSKIITQELLNFARSKPSKIVETVEDLKRKNLQTLIDKLNQFSKNYRSQKDSYRRSINFKNVSLKYPNVIIVKPEEKNLKLKNSIGQEIQKVKTGKNFEDKPKHKTYSYDWEQFEKRCLFVKQVFENLTQSNRSDSPFRKEEECDSQIHLHSNSQPYDFSLQENSYNKVDTHSTPKNLFKSKGFTPYKELNATGIKDHIEEFQGISQKINYQSNSF